jgi:hypothetical protein
LRGRIEFLIFCRLRFCAFRFFCRLVQNDAQKVTIK